MNISGTNWYYYVTAFVALAGVIFAAYKLKPESTKIFVETAKVTMEMANDQRDDLEEKLAKLASRQDEIERRAQAAKLRADEMEKKVAAANARADTAATVARELRDELEDEREKVLQLTATVKALQEELSKHDIEIPPHLNGPSVISEGG